MRPLLILACLAGMSAIAIAIATRDDGAEGVSAARNGISGTGGRVPTAGCESLVEQRIPPPTERDLVVGPVVLQGARARADDPRSDYRQAHGRDPVAKVPVIVKPDARVVLRVVERDRTQASLQYRQARRGADRVREGDRAVRFRACFRDNPTGWPGAFLLKGPRCVGVTLAIQGRSPVRRTLRFGRKVC